MLPLRSALLLTILAIPVLAGSACGFGPPTVEGEVSGVGDLPDPRARGTLEAEGTLPMEFRAMAMVSPDTFMALDGRGLGLWRIVRVGGSLVFEPAPSFSVDPSDRSLVIASGPKGVGVLSRRGRFMIYDPLDWTLTHDGRYFGEMGTAVIGLTGVSDGTWVLAQLRPGQQAHPTDALVELRQWLPGESSREVAALPGGRGGLLADFPTFTILGDRILVSLASAHEVVEYSPNEEFNNRSSVIHGGPLRQLSAAERRRFTAAAQGLPRSLREALILPEQLPNVVGAWPVQGGLLVRAAAPGDTFVLDWYCGSVYRHTLSGLRRIQDVWVFPDQILVLRAAEGGFDRILEVYSLEDLDLGCE